MFFGLNRIDVESKFCLGIRMVMQVGQESKTTSWPRNPTKLLDQHGCLAS